MSKLLNVQISHTEVMSFLALSPTFFKEHLLHLATYQSLSSMNTYGHPLLRASHWARHGSLQELMQHISKEIRTDLLGEWCPTNPEYVVNQLYSLAHSKTQRVGFNSEFKAKLSRLHLREPLDSPGEKHQHELLNEDIASLPLETCSGADSFSSQHPSWSPEILTTWYSCHRMVPSHHEEG